MESSSPSIPSHTVEPIPVEESSSSKEIEKPWIDAWIRWERNQEEEEDDDDDEEEDNDEDTSSRPVPTETFSFTYNLPIFNSSSQMFITEKEKDHEKNDNDNNNPHYENGDEEEETVLLQNNDNKHHHHDHNIKKQRRLVTLTLQGFPSESESIWNSTGLTIWPCSHYLCDYLIEQYTNTTMTTPRRGRPPSSSSTSSSSSNSSSRNLFSTTTTQHTNILELGSGLGCCGLVMYHLLILLEESSSLNNKNNNHIFLTDGDTDTLRQLRNNVQQNTTPTTTTHSTYSTTAITTISCHQLLWGTQSAIEFAQRHYGETTATASSQLCQEGYNNNNVVDDHHEEERELKAKDDHNTTSGGGESSSSPCTNTTSRKGMMNLILGSDLIYVPCVIEPLFATVQTLLLNDDTNSSSGSGSNFLLAHSDRRQGSSVTVSMVLDGAKAANFKYEIVFQEKDIYIIRFFF